MDDKTTVKPAPVGVEGSYLPISDYAIIGDSGCAALVSKRGSIDWFCFPHFDSPPVFGALVDVGKGGRFSVCPAGGFRTERRYIENSNVLETDLIGDGGTVRLTDLVPVDDPTSGRLDPQRWLVRKVECIAGEAQVEVDFRPRPTFGKEPLRLRDRNRLGIVAEYYDSALTLVSDIPLAVSQTGQEAVGAANLRKGDCRYLALAGSYREPAIIPVTGEPLERTIRHTVQWWRNWVSTTRYEGIYRDHVLRSILTLKLLNYAPSGALVAAPTSSLPERIGGERNWDYRFCWLRDASMVFRAFSEVGFEQESYAFLAWALHSTRLSWPDLQVLYDIYGETRLHERELRDLEGYAGSRPVRMGNGARGQFQLDVFGEVVDAAFQYAVHGGSFDRTTQRMLVGLGEAVCRRWREPDHGIWEIRSDRRHHTYSKAMCWVALDCLLRLHADGHISVDERRFRRECDTIRHAIEEEGFNRQRGTYTSVFGGAEVDGSLLLMPLYGYTERGDERMAGTHRRIREDLGKNGLLYRFKGSFDGLSPGEGAFVVCSFWEAAYLARDGRLEEARGVFEHVAGFANDVGLFAEELDPETGAALGNFPQGFSHVGLVNAAVEIERNGRGAAH